VQYDCREYDLKDGTTTWIPPNWRQLSEYANSEPAPGAWPHWQLYAYAQKDELHYVLEDGGTYSVAYYDLEYFNNTPDLPERAQFKGGKNAGEYKTKKVKVDDHTKPKSRIVKRPFTFPGYTKPKAKWAGADPGVWSTSAAVVEELAASTNVPFLKAYAELMAMTKDLGTYYYRKDEDGKETGMLTLVDWHGIIHHKLNMTSTVTARLSSSDPNLQNIPKGNKSDVKTIFVSRFGADGKIIQSDFSSLEVYVQAVLTGCKQLIADLKSGLDLHVVRLAAKEHMEYDEVYALCKGDKYDKEWDYKRTKAKTYSFQRAYGAGIAKIAESTGMSEEEVQALADAEDVRYPEISQYYEAITAEINANRVPERTLPHPDVPGVICHLGKSYLRTPDGKLYTYVEQPSPEYLCRRGKTASFSPTEIRNYVVQGAGGEWMKAAMWLTVRAFYARKNFDGQALIVNTVHDASYVDAHADVAFQAAALLHACMELASEFMEKWFNWTIPVPVPSDTSWGSSMADEDKIPGLKELAALLRTELRKEYLGGYVASFLN